MLIGQKALYIYKPNEGNSYLRMSGGSVDKGGKSDSDIQKKKHGGFFISKMIPPIGTCDNYSESYKTCYNEPE